MHIFTIIFTMKLGFSDLISQNRLGNNRLALKSYRPPITHDCFSCQILKFLINSDKQRNFDSNLLQEILTQDFFRIIKLKRMGAEKNENLFFN